MIYWMDVILLTMSNYKVAACIKCGDKGVKFSIGDKHKRYAFGCMRGCYFLTEDDYISDVKAAKKMWNVKNRKEKNYEII